MAVSVLQHKDHAVDAEALTLEEEQSSSVAAELECATGRSARRAFSFSVPLAGRHSATTSDSTSLALGRA